MLIASYLGVTEQALAPEPEQPSDDVSRGSTTIVARRGTITTATEDAVRTTAENLVARRVPLPAPIAFEPAVKPKKSYPIGTLYYYIPETGMYMVSLPLSAKSLEGAFGAFGEDGVTNLPPEPTPVKPELPAQETTKEVVEKASGISPVVLIEPPQPSTPMWKKWQFWAAVSGGVVVLGTGGYFILRGARR
jgi:hypothetical protein